MVIGRIVLVVFSVSMFTFPFAAAEEWPNAMTPDEVSARTNVHDGYVFHVLPLTTAPVEQRGQPSQSTFDYLTGYSPKLQRWIRLPDGRLPKGLTYVGVRATLRCSAAEPAARRGPRDTDSLSHSSTPTPIGYQRWRPPPQSHTNNRQKPTSSRRSAPCSYHRLGITDLDLGTQPARSAA